MKYEIVDARYVRTHLADTVIVDVRPFQMYAESRIPGAVSIPYMAWRAQHGADERLGDSFKAKGVYENTHVIVYCFSGDLAREVCARLHDEGYYHIHCYEGSWLDWISDSANPTDDRMLPAV